MEDYIFNDSVFHLLDFNYYYDENFTVFSRDLPTYRIVIPWIVICIGFPLTLLAIYALYLLVQKDHVAPVYVINLLVSDLVQMCYLAVWLADPTEMFFTNLLHLIYLIAVMASVGFMVCIALERYLVVACPLWYRFRRSIYLSVCVSIGTWVLSIAEGFIAMLIIEIPAIRYILFLLPLPLLIFSLAGTLKALSASTSVHAKEKRRIIATLVLVLLNYMVLFMPMVMLPLCSSYGHDPFNESHLSLAFLQFSPLADLVLYVFMRKGAVDKLLAHICCCKLTREEEQGQVTNENNETTEKVCSV